MQVTINIPDFAPFTLNKDMQELKQTIKLNCALMLFKKEKLSIEQASNFADMNIYDFMTECGKNNIAIISYEENELENELRLMKNV